MMPHFTISFVILELRDAFANILNSSAFHCDLWQYFVRDVWVTCPVIISVVKQKNWLFLSVGSILTRLVDLNSEKRQMPHSSPAMSSQLPSSN